VLYKCLNLKPIVMTLGRYILVVTVVSGRYVVVVATRMLAVCVTGDKLCSLRDSKDVTLRLSTFGKLHLLAC